MKITLAQFYDIEVPKEYENKTKEELLNDINKMYDISGKDILKTMSAEEDYQYTQLTHINDEEVCIENNRISSSGYQIILDGQPLNS